MFQQRREHLICVAIAGFLAFPMFAEGQVVPGQSAGPAAPAMQAVRLSSSVQIDGRLDDPAWALVPPVSGWLQRSPDEGSPATEATDARVAYDGSAFYVALRLWDSEPSRIGRQLSRRDAAAEADTVTLYLDPYHDRRSGVVFEVSAAGVQRDALIYDDNRLDYQWDAVWESAVSVDDEGWSAEIRIPLSQLRFARATNQVWGINLSRYLLRRAEDTWLQVVPKDAQFLASRMATLEGLRELPRTAHLEVLPYAVGIASFVAARPGDPFHDGSERSSNAGLDLKWSPSSNLTLNATVMPDFGQVELDPSVVNLTAFETFFSEKRPFFLEGSSIFAPATGNSLFYSRRVGRSPQLIAGGDCADVPAAATILGALKLTGKVGGWNIGLMDAYTDREIADVETRGERTRVEVEPRTNYFVGRVGLSRPAGGIGIMATTTHRELRTPVAVGLLAKEAYAAGIDGYAYFGSEQSWKVAALLQGSRVTGAAPAIGLQQRSSRRYYQRPDATHVELDGEATSLEGWRGQVDVGRQRGEWQLKGSAAATSPGFEINDLGFQTRADSVDTSVGLSWTTYQVEGVSRSQSVALTKRNRWNFGRQRQYDSWGLDIGFTFLNYWYLNASASFDRESFDDRLTRGGPLAVLPRQRRVSAIIGSDPRKRLSFYIAPFWSESGPGGWSRGASTGLVAKPANAVSISIAPSYYDASFRAQYVTRIADATATPTFGARYVFAPIAIKQASLTMRLDMALTPKFSIQAYLEPFVGVGQYGGLMEFARPGSFEFARYGVDAGTVSVPPSGSGVLIDPDGTGPAGSFTIGALDYSSKSLKLKTVMRWEFRPGSTLYIAWTQQRFDNSRPGVWDLSRDARSLWTAPADDVLLVKMSYWLGR